MIHYKNNQHSNTSYHNITSNISSSISSYYIIRLVIVSLLLLIVYLVYPYSLHFPTSSSSSYSSSSLSSDILLDTSHTQDTTIMSSSSTSTSLVSIQPYRSSSMWYDHGEVNLQQTDPVINFSILLRIPTTIHDRISDAFHDVSNPHSPQYGHYWKQSEIQKLTKPKEEDINTIREWVGKDMKIDVSDVQIKVLDMALSRASKLFHCTFHEFSKISSSSLNNKNRDKNNILYRCTSDLHVPTHIHHLVAHISGINDFPVIIKPPHQPIQDIPSIPLNTQPNTHSNSHYNDHQNTISPPPPSSSSSSSSSHDSPPYTHPARFSAHAKPPFSLRTKEQIHELALNFDKDHLHQHQQQQQQHDHTQHQQEKEA